MFCISIHVESVGHSQVKVGGFSQRMKTMWSCLDLVLKSPWGVPFVLSIGGPIARKQSSHLQCQCSGLIFRIAWATSLVGGCG